MSANHTPGPWSVGIADWTDAGNARYELRGIKTVSAPDARLIESAPDLLAERDRLKAANAELVEVLQAIEVSLGVLRIPAAEVLDENSPIRDALRAALAQHDKETA